MTGARLVEVMPRARNFIPARLHVVGLAVPPAHAERGERYWHVDYSDGRRRVMAERTLNNERLFSRVLPKGRA